jgi:hypothetical protein
MKKLSLSAVVLIAGATLASPSFAQDQKPLPPRHLLPRPCRKMAMTRRPEMVARMNKMMDQCEKMMSEGDVHKGMMRHMKRHHRT